MDIKTQFEQELSALLKRYGISIVPDTQTEKLGTVVQTRAVVQFVQTHQPEFTEEVSLGATSD
jgi:hypothetical protein